MSSRRIALILATVLALPGCVAVAAVDAVGTVAAVGVKTTAKVAGATAGMAVDGVSAAGHAVTGRR